MRIHRLTTCFGLMLAVLAALACGGTAEGEDFPMFRGPMLSGIGDPGPGLADGWPDGGPKLLWRSDDLGVVAWDHGKGQVAIVNGLAYVNTRRQTEGEWQRLLTCLDADGRVLWQYMMPCAPAKGHQTENPTPCVIEGKVYAQLDQRIVCLDARSGQAVWARDVPELGYTVQSPLVTGGVMVIRSGPGLMAFRLSDGERAWTFKGRGSASLCTPTLWKTPGGTHVVAMVDEQKQAVCVVPADGSVLWDLVLDEGEQRIQSDNRLEQGMPTVTDDHLVLSRIERRPLMVYRLFPDEPRRQPDLLWTSDRQQNAPLIHQGHVYIGYTRRDVYKAFCLDLATGEPRWLFGEQTGTTAILERGFKNYCDPILVDGKTFVTMNKKVFMFRPNPNDLGFLGKTPPIDSADTSSPAIADGRMWVLCYSRQGKATVACFDISAPPGAKPTITLTQAGLDPATVGRWYERRLWVSSGNGMRTWRISEGKLPAGLTLDPKGYITGRATEAGEFPLTLTVADEDGDTDAGAFTLSVRPAAN